MLTRSIRVTGRQGVQSGNDYAYGLNNPLTVSDRSDLQVAHAFVQFGAHMAYMGELDYLEQKKNAEWADESARRVAEGDDPARPISFYTDKGAGEAMRNVEAWDTLVQEAKDQQAAENAAASGQILSGLISTAVAVVAQGFGKLWPAAAKPIRPLTKAQLMAPLKGEAFREFFKKGLPGIKDRCGNLVVPPQISVTQLRNYAELMWRAIHSPKTYYNPVSVGRLRIIIKVLWGV